MVAREEGTLRDEQQLREEQQGEEQQGEEQPQPSPPWNMYVVLAAMFLVTAVAALVLIFYRSVFTNATDVTTLLASLFTVVGTVVGAYFGIKSTNDTTDKAMGQVEKEAKRTERANQAARAALRG